MSESAGWSTRRKVLTVTSDERGGERLSKLLVDAGYQVTTYRDVRKLAEIVLEEHPDLLVVDLRGSGDEERDRVVDACADGSVGVPALVLASGDEAVPEALSAACTVDWLCDDGETDVLLTRVRAMLRVAADASREHGTDKRDGLTRVYNRRYFDERLDMEIERARRYGRKVSCVMVDIDGFKRVNSTYGHQTGDRVLKVLADILLSGTRASDVVARYGGEEFVVILPEAAGDEAAVLAERLRRSFEKRAPRLGDGDAPVTVSCGVATYPDHAADSATLMRMADSAVYRAKSEGRNRCVVAFSELEDASGGAGSSARILLVEDNDYNRSIASLVLRASGYEVLEASDAETGVSLARTTHPDLVLIDLQIHGMSGLEATRRIVQMDETKDIPVVALTTGDVPDSLEELARAGCRGYITKPIDTNALASQIQLYLKG